GGLLGVLGVCGVGWVGVCGVVDSAYFAWFTMQSCEIYKNNVIEHYVIATSNDVIDVLSTVSPQIQYD
ncbi:hypothetical protein ACQ7A7_06855, partial [Escherichia coli]